MATPANASNSGRNTDGLDPSVNLAALSQVAPESKPLSSVTSKVSRLVSQTTLTQDQSADMLRLIRHYGPRLADILKKWNSGALEAAAESFIYEMLTTRSQFAMYRDSGQSVENLSQKYAPQRAWYRSVRESLEHFSSTGNSPYSWESNPGWFWIDVRPESKANGINIKAYVTIPATHYAFIRCLPELVGRLRTLAVSTDDSIKIKVPQNFTGFIAHNDSVVVHFKKKENAEKILQLLDVWLFENDIPQSPREFGRTRIAADSESASFSQLVSRNIAQWTVSHLGKYPPAVLAHRAITHAVSQSQKPPFTFPGKA